MQPAEQRATSRPHEGPWPSPGCLDRGESRRVVARDLTRLTRRVLTGVAWLVAATWMGHACAQESRTWTDASGQHKVEATLVEVQRDAVVLQMADGSQKTIQLKQLSEADRTYAAEARKAMLAENAAKKKASAEAKKQGDDVKDEVKALLDGFRQRVTELQQSTPDAAQLRNAIMPMARETAQQAMKLIESAPQSDVAKEVYLWTLRSAPQTPEAAAAATLMIEHFADSPEMAQLLPLIGRDSRNLDALLKVAKDPTIRALAMFSLARGLSNDESPAAEKRAIELLREIVAKHAKVEDARRQPLGPQAERLLFAVENLKIGKVAPDIKGVDLDGVDFKLSDYRGKVVVLDFWGDW